MRFLLFLALLVLPVFCQCTSTPSNPANPSSLCKSRKCGGACPESLLCRHDRCDLVVGLDSEASVEFVRTRNSSATYFLFNRVGDAFSNIKIPAWDERASRFTFQGLKLSTVASLTKSVPSAWSLGAKNVVDDIFYSPVVRLSHRALTVDATGGNGTATEGENGYVYGVPALEASVSLLVTASSKDVAKLQESLCLGTMSEAGTWSCVTVSEWIVGLKESFVTTVAKVPLPSVGSAAVYAIILAAPAVPSLTDVQGPRGPRDGDDGDDDGKGDEKERKEGRVAPLIIGVAVVAVTVLCGVGALIARVVILRSRARALHGDSKSASEAAHAAAIAAAVAASSSPTGVGAGAFYRSGTSHMECDEDPERGGKLKREGSSGNSSAELDRIQVDVGDKKVPPNIVINPFSPGPEMHITMYGAAGMGPRAPAQFSPQASHHQGAQQLSTQQPTQSLTQLPPSKQGSTVTFGESRYLPMPPRLQSHSSSTSSRLVQQRLGHPEPQRTVNSGAGSGADSAGRTAGGAGAQPLPLPEPAALLPALESQHPVSPPGQVRSGGIGLGDGLLGRGGLGAGGAEDSFLSAPHSPGVPLIVGGEGATPLSPDLRMTSWSKPLPGAEDLDDDYGGQDADEAFSFTTTALSGKSLSTRGKARKERELEKKETQVQQAKLISEFEQGLDGLLSLMQAPTLQ